MTRDEAIANLSSADTELRLKAARFFTLNASASDQLLLRKALSKESVPWIKRALDRSLERLKPPTELATSTIVYADPPKQLVAELRAKVIDEVAGTIIHELSTIVASLKLAAPRDFPDYAGSRTETLVNSLASLLSGIRSLKTAASKANFAECDLAQECHDACYIFGDKLELFRFAGQSPFLVETDPDLLKLALSNVIKNAVEAVSVLPEDSDQSVTLNWGRAGHEYWVSVLDSGLGFDREPFSMVEFGKSTKDKHIGFGLATAKQAMLAMGGDVYPENAVNGGARVVLKWFCNDEYSVR